MLNWLYEWGWGFIPLWMLLYVADYYYTYQSQRVYTEGHVSQHLEIEGGNLELNPMFKRDIAGLRKLSPRFILFLFLVPCIMAFYFWLTRVGILGRYREVLLWAYELLTGSLICLWLFILTRHVRNLFTFREMKSGSVQGKITYSLRFANAQLRTESILFSLLYLIFFGLTFRWFFLGGALSCLSLGLRTRRWAKHQEPVAQTAQSER